MTDSSLNCSSTGSRRPEIGENRSVTGSNSISSISSSTKKKKICFDGAMKKIVNETDAKVEEFEKWMLGSVLLIGGLVLLRGRKFIIRSFCGKTKMLCQTKMHVRRG